MSQRDRLTRRDWAVTWSRSPFLTTDGQSASALTTVSSHLVRHTFAQTMARKGAPIADIQDVLGHTSDKMARHYPGEARKAAAAELMAKYSLAGWTNRFR
jgi:integrase